MSADKYPSIFSRQMATIVYLYGILLTAIKQGKKDNNNSVETKTLNDAFEIKLLLRKSLLFKSQ